MRDASGKVLYVGKARNLRARLRNYTNDTDSRYSVKYLMRRVAHVEFLVVASEKEALLLENSLIKTHKPRYNVRLRDDKNYISIRLNPNEPFPRLMVVRKHKNDGARYFGPYHDTHAARKTMKQLQRLVPLRVCSDHVMHNRARPCIYHQIKQCLAPCVGLINEDDYRRQVNQALLILEGRCAELKGELRDRIRELAEQMRFEEAALVRDRLHDLEVTVAPQRAIVRTGARDKDVFGYCLEGQFMEIQVLYYRNNAMIGGNSFSFDHIEAPIPELFSSFLLQYYGSAPVIPQEILVPVKLEEQKVLSDLLSEKKGAKIIIKRPQKGALKSLVELANKNAKQAFTEKRGAEKALQDALERIQALFLLSGFPRRIECFDVSTIQGNKTVAAMAVFENGKPVKQRYRRYEIRDSGGQDDFGAMREVLRRRYSRAIAENELPDLVLIDGGKGHLSVAVKTLKTLALESLPCVGIAKARATGRGVAAHERFYIPNRMNPIVPPQGGAVVRLLARIRDEAHRFAITYHRLKRKKSAFATALLELPGIGPARARALLKSFGSVQRIRAANVEQLAAVPGISGKLAQEIADGLRTRK